MRKFGKLSLLFIALSTATVSGNFYLSNLSNNTQYINTTRNSLQARQSSDKVYINITNIMFQEDLKIKVKYTIQTGSGSVVDEEFINSTLYGTELVIMQKGSTDFGGAGEVERVAFDRIELIPDDTSDTSGTATSDSIQLNNGLYEKGTSYDAYIFWHEYDDAGELNSDVWYNTTPSTFTTPVSEFPVYSLKKEFEGANQALVSFNVDYDDALTIEEVGLNNAKYFFSVLRLYWDDNIIDGNMMDVTDVIHDDVTQYQNVWLEWDEANTSFKYYLLIDNLSTALRDVTYEFAYNWSNFGTGQRVDNFDSPLQVKAGNKYSDLPIINYTYDVPEDPTTLSDYQRVDLNFSVSENSVWVDDYNEVVNHLGEDASLFELKPNNSMTTITVDNILSDVGEVPVGAQVSYDTEKINDYNTALTPITIKGLNPGTTYTADATLNLNNDIFAMDSVTIPIEFSTLSTIDQPTFTYVNDDDLDGTEFTDWSRDVLNFNLSSPTNWNFTDELIMPRELYKSGDLKIYNNGSLEEEVSISETELATLNEGANKFDTSTKGILLDAGTNYTFTLDLEYSSKAKGLFNQEFYPTVSGSFKTKDQIIAPTLRFVGSDLVADDKTSMNLRFEIVDDTNQFNGLDGEPLTLAETFDELKITEFKEVSDDDSLIDDSTIDYSDTVSASELVTASEGENEIMVSGLKGDKTYEFTAVLTYDTTANAEDPDGWVPYNEEGQLSITKRISTDSKFESFDVQASVIDISKDDGKPTWSSTVEVRVPEGNETESGLNSPEANVNISYELFDYNKNEVIARNTIGKDEWIKDGLTGELYCNLEFSNLAPSSTYRLSTISSFNSDVIVGVNDATATITTGVNNGFTNDMLTASWGIRDETEVEVYNEYDDIFVSLSVDPTNATNDEFLQGYESVQLLDSFGNVVDTNSDIVLSDTPKPTLWLNKTFQPKTTLSGYKVKIINDDNTVDSGDEYLLEDLVLPGLAQPVTTLNVSSDSPTSASYSVDFDNFNNVESANLEIRNATTEEVVWNEFFNSTQFVGDDSGNKRVTDSTGSNVLEAETEYVMSVKTTYKDFVESPQESSVVEQSFTTMARETVKPTYSIDANYDTVKVDYSWTSNTSDFNNLTKINAQILTPKNNYLETLVPEQSVDIVGQSGSGSFEFAGLDSGIEYKVVLNAEFENVLEPVETTLFITTDQKINTFNSDFELKQTSENSIDINYMYEGLITEETASQDAVSSIKLSLYEGEAPIGSPLSTYEMDLTELQTSGVKELTVDNPTIIIPNHSYTLEEEVVFTSFTKWTTADGLGEPVYDVRKQTKTIDINFDPSIVTSNIEFIDRNTLEVEIRVNDVDEFINSNGLSISLYSSGDLLNVVFEGVGKTFNNKQLSSVELSYYLSDESTEDEFVYDFILNGVYVPEGKDVELEIQYNNKDCGSSTTQTFEALVDPNSMKALNRYEYGVSNYIYEISLTASDLIDLNEDVSFTSVNSTQIQESEVRVIDKSIVEENDLEYNSNNLYLKVNKSTTNNSDWRSLDFMVGRYMVINNPATRSVVDFNTQSAYLISDFGMIPMPKEPLTFKEFVIIILLIILFIIIVWWLIYRFIKSHRREKWYKYALSKANGYYFMHKRNMDMYGWNHKFNEYESLSNMSIPELKAYAKKLKLPIPYGLRKQELIDLLSFLSETELLRIKEYSNYQIEIPQKVRDELLEEFQTDPKESKWMKKRFAYTIDRAARMQSEDYKKTMTDRFVDLYSKFDVAFVSLTDSILISLKLKKKPAKVVEVKDHEWDDHHESADIEEGTIIETEAETNDEEVKTESPNKDLDTKDSKGGDDND